MKGVTWSVFTALALCSCGIRGAAGDVGESMRAGMDREPALPSGVPAGFQLAQAVPANDKMPVIRRQPRNLVAPLGTRSNLTVVATSGLPLSYQWQKEGVDLKGETGPTLSFPNLQPADDGLYWVRVRTTAGEVRSRNSKVQALFPPVITNQVPELTLHKEQGSTVQLKVFADDQGVGPLKYEWYKDGILTPLYKGAYYFLHFDDLASEGRYAVVVRSPGGSVTSQVWVASSTLKGGVTAWGDNAHRQLNLDRTETNLVAVAAGALHSLGLRENGTVIAWGENAEGQCNVPKGLTNVVAIAAGRGHSLALRDDGTVVAWGANTRGQTDVPSRVSKVTGIAAGSDHSLALREDGTVLAWGDDQFGALRVPAGMRGAKQVAAGNGLSFALLADGAVRAWGSGGQGGVSVPEDLREVVQIAAADAHALALLASGRVIGLGRDSGWGETRSPHDLTNAMQVAIGATFGLALRNDGSVTVWGQDDRNLKVPAVLGDTKMVAAGRSHALALAYDPMLMYPVDVSQDLLVIYNRGSRDSVRVKDYYLAHRPKVSGCLELGLSCPRGETCTTNEYFESIRGPYLEWLERNPTKRPAYLLLMYDVPSRFDDRFLRSLSLATPEELRGSIAYALRECTPARRPYVTSLNMATTQDCFAYVDKLASFGATYSPGKLRISPHAGGYRNDYYAIDNARIPVHRFNTNYLGARDALIDLGVPKERVLFTDGLVPGAPHIFQATNVAAFANWGFHGGGELGTRWATNGVVRFQGDSGWYIMMTVESWNGQWEPFDYQGSYRRWHERNSFGGSNYANTPVGSISHVWEPLCISRLGTYMTLWDAGKYFSICAWSAECLPKLQATGDPFVCR